MLDRQCRDRYGVVGRSTAGAMASALLERGRYGLIEARDTITRIVFAYEAGLRGLRMPGCVTNSHSNIMQTR